MLNGEVIWQASDTTSLTEELHDKIIFCRFSAHHIPTSGVGSWRDADAHESSAHVTWNKVSLNGEVKLGHLGDDNY